MRKKKAKKKAKRVTVTLALRDYEKLTRYAQLQGVSRPLAAKRLLRSQLSALAIDLHYSLFTT